MRIWPLFIFLFVSCAHVQSGHYVVLTGRDTMESLSKEFNVPTWQLESANLGRPFKKGEKYFVPLNRGLLPRLKRKTAAINPSAISGEFLWPVPASKVVSSQFGHRWGRKHEGIDIPARKGTKIVATQSGVVVYSGAEIGGYGNITVISHPGGYFSVYAHAKRNFTRKGQKVHQGQVIAEVGSTGRSTGPHLHFEIRHDSRAIDPKGLLTKK